MKSITLLIALCALSFTSCEKIAGPGGSSTIIGKVYIIDKNAGGTVVAEGNGQKVDVFIVYGEDGVAYDDDVQTSYDGTFKFENLEPGKYTVFLYEDCNTCVGGKQALVYPVEITEKKSTVDLGTLTIIE